MGTLIESVLPFPLPASVIAMLILLVLLAVRALRPEHVQEKSDFLLGNLQFFFIPATVGIMNYVDVLRENLVVLPVICAVSTVATFAVTAATVTFTNRLLNRRKQSGAKPLPLPFSAWRCRWRHTPWAWPSRERPGW